MPQQIYAEIIEAIEAMRIQYTGHRGPESMFYPAFYLPPDEDEKGHLLRELVILCSDHLQEIFRGETYLDNLCMSAGEQAFAVLNDYELITIDPRGYRCATWTDKGRKLLETSRLETENHPTTK